MLFRSLNKYDEFITNINGNKHHIYKVKKAIDLYMGIAKRHNINIPFESEIYSLLKSINATYNTYTKNILDLQKTSENKLSKKQLIKKDFGTGK